MVILIDLDNVLIKTGEAWVAEINSRHGTSVAYDDITWWEIEDFFPSLTHDEVYAPLTDGSAWDRVTPVDGAQEYVQKLIDDGHDLYIATSSSLNTIGKKWTDIIRKFFPIIPHNNVIVSHAKQMIRADVLIDDAPFNIVGGEYTGILFDAPHNREYAASNCSIKRAKSWKEVYDLIEEMG